MGRIHLFELEDQRWLPGSLRDTGTDFLRFMMEVGKVFRPIIPRLKNALDRTGSEEILDLCSGGGGPVLDLAEHLVVAGHPVRVTLSDLYPNLAAFKYARNRSGGAIDFLEEPLDATAVPAHLSGFSTLFASFHHFRPEVAQRILQHAVDQRRPIGVFDMTARRPPPLPLALLGNPLGMLIATPLVRPFKWSRLFWSYVLPAAPFFLAWDALVSGFRLYSVKELHELVNGLQGNEYEWEIGREGPLGLISYLIGYPKHRPA